MATSRIPPIQCLLTFEAVARLRSASRAAAELCVTVSAISHRIRQLESHLGIRLFCRFQSNRIRVNHIGSTVVLHHRLLCQPN